MAVGEKKFDALVQAAFADLPTIFREACKDVTIRIETVASSEVMASLDLADPYELLGLYHGINLAEKSILDLPHLPDEVIIYRDPIINYADANGLALADATRHVLVHEIGHHFGFSDADMEAIERNLET